MERRQRKPYKSLAAKMRGRCPTRRRGAPCGAGEVREPDGQRGVEERGHGRDGGAVVQQDLAVRGAIECFGDEVIDDGVVDLGFGAEALRHGGLEVIDVGRGVDSMEGEAISVTITFPRGEAAKG